ncbi:MAG: hypothetical protein JO254_17345 [Pseudolabrys sp.]|nr:hypothetical protein [Pseudolabrys sp.]
MNASHVIARIAGPVMAALGLGLLTNYAVYRQIATQIVSNLPLVYFSGVLLMTGGLAILNFHNRWTADWRSIITALGWLMMLSGVFRVFAPQLASFVATSATLGNAAFLMGVGIVFTALGGFITYKSYTA